MKGYTPGPWKVVRDGDGSRRIVSDSVFRDWGTNARYLTICKPNEEVPWEPMERGIDTPEADANAALIARAPALAEEVERLRGALERITEIPAGANKGVCQKIARAALAGEGGSK